MHAAGDDSQVLWTNLASRHSLPRDDVRQANRWWDGDEVTRQDDASLKAKKSET